MNRSAILAAIAMSPCLVVPHSAVAQYAAFDVAPPVESTLGTTASTNALPGATADGSLGPDVSGGSYGPGGLQ